MYTLALSVQLKKCQRYVKVARHEIFCYKTMGNFKVFARKKMQTKSQITAKLIRKILLSYYLRKNRDIKNIRFQVLSFSI